MENIVSVDTHLIGDSILKLSTLGAGNEVGRSCFVIEYNNKKVMLDCGTHPAYEKHDARPYFEHLGDMSQIDMILISHFHVDHVGSLPYLTQHTDFHGRIFMTHPTKAISNMILTDSIKVTHDGVWTENDLRQTMKKVETINYHQEVTYKGVRFVSYNAGHVLGAAMFLIEIGGIKILYTGDYSRQEDRHLKAAELPSLKPDVLIVESTYGTQDQEPRKDRETRLVEKIMRTIKGGGRVLLPIFALGRVQELLLIIDELWKAHSDLQKIPVYFATSLGKKCMVVYQTYVDMMVDSIQKRMASENPFNFQFIRDLRSVDELNDRHPCIVLASPGMLQSGISRDLFDRWCGDERNAVIIAGYTVENTLAHEILKEPPNVVLKSGKIVPLKLSVHAVSFSAHVDCSKNTQFIDALKPPHIVLVHGARAEMRNLRLKLEEKYKGQSIKVWSPENNTTIDISFRKDMQCHLVGRIAEKCYQHVLKDISLNLEQLGQVEYSHEEKTELMQVDEFIRSDDTPLVDIQGPSDDIMLHPSKPMDLKQLPILLSPKTEQEKNPLALEDHSSLQISASSSVPSLLPSSDSPNSNSIDQSGQDVEKHSSVQAPTLLVTGKLNGVFIVQDFDQILVDITDLHYFSNLTTTIISQTLKIPLHAIRFTDIKQYLSHMFDFIEGPIEYEGQQALVCGSLCIVSTGENEVTLKWNSTPNDDMMADSIITILSHVQNNPNAFNDDPITTIDDLSKLLLDKPQHLEDDMQDDSAPSSLSTIDFHATREKDQLQAIMSFMSTQFSKVDLDESNLKIHVYLDKKEAVFCFLTKKIRGQDQELNNKLNRILINIFSVLFPVTRQEPDFLDSFSLEMPSN